MKLSQLDSVIVRAGGIVFLTWAGWVSNNVIEMGRQLAEVNEIAHAFCQKSGCARESTAINSNQTMKGKKL